MIEKNFEQLEEGRSYRNRSGNVITTVQIDEHGSYPAIGNEGDTYTRTGPFMGGDNTNPNDLVELLPIDSVKPSMRRYAKAVDTTGYEVYGQMARFDNRLFVNTNRGLCELVDGKLKRIPLEV